MERLRQTECFIPDQILSVHVCVGCTFLKNGCSHRNSNKLPKACQSLMKVWIDVSGRLIWTFSRTFEFTLKTSTHQLMLYVSHEATVAAIAVDCLGFVSVVVIGL